MSISGKLNVRRSAALISGWLLVLATAGCGPATSASPTATVTPPDSVSCGDHTGFSSATPAPTEPGATPTPTPNDAPDAEFPQDEVPSGSWSGPITVSVVGTPNTASGTVYSAGGGSVSVVIRDHQVQSGTATFTATSSGTIVTADGGRGEIHGALTMTDGVVTGSATTLHVAGTAVMTGSILITVHGVNITKPLDGSVPMTATLTITTVNCESVVATFLPDLNDKTGGRGVFTGTAKWHGERTG